MKPAALFFRKCAGGGFAGFGVAGALAAFGCSMESLAEVHENGRIEGGAWWRGHCPLKRPVRRVILH
jgi:hypothetical protein